jgi:iron complex transport system ATP-binding protein
MLSIQNISVAYGRHQVIEDLSLEFEHGKLYGVIGPNGAGKSTLLNALAKDLHIESGSIQLNGQDIKSFSSKEYARKLSYMRQRMDVKFPYTVWELVSMGRYAYEGSSKREHDQIVLEKIKENDLEDYIHKSVTEMSGGEVQRTFFAKILAQDSQVILVDEGLSNADIFHKVKFFEQLHREVAKGKLVIMVLHDLFLARRFCDELVILNKEGIYKAGKSEDVLNKQTLQDVFMVQGDFVNDALVLE